MKDVVNALILLGLVLGLPWVCSLAVPRLIRRATRASDNRIADELIARNKATWRTDTGTADGTPMDRADWHRINRAGERRWQEALRAQQRTRQPSVPPDLTVVRGRR